MKSEKGNKSIEAFFTYMFATEKSTVEFAQQNYPHLKNLNFADSGTGSREIDLLIDSDYLWEFVSGKVKYRTGNKPRGTDTVFGYVLSGPVANVEVIKVNNQNYQSLPPRSY